MLSNIEKCQLLAIVAHRGQTDKQGQPYIYHPAWVAGHLGTDEEKTVAWLHDVIEDTEFTLADLRCLGLNCKIIDALEAITKRDGESYKKYINRVKKNELATKVKLVDLRHNMERYHWLGKEERTKKAKKRFKKYEHAFAYLSL